MAKVKERKEEAECLAETCSKACCDMQSMLDDLLSGTSDSLEFDISEALDSSFKEMESLCTDLQKRSKHIADWDGRSERGDYLIDQADALAHTASKDIESWERTEADLAKSNSEIRGVQTSLLSDVEKLNRISSEFVMHFPMVRT